MKNSVDYAYPKLSKHWLPITWAANITTRARLDQKIHNDVAAKTIIDELNKFRGQCGLLLSYDSISVPLVYTQVVTLAVYTYFITCIMGRQWVEGIDENLQKQRNSIDLYFPIFTTLQFFFYMGWLKVAESLINPFGEDDDDFEVNWLVDRNLQYDDAQSGIQFSAGPKRRSISRVNTRERMTSAGSATSMNTGSQASSLHRSGSVKSVIWRLFSREGPTGTTAATQTPVTVDGGGQPSSIPTSNSSASLHSKLVPGGSMRLADQVIEEVDEQSTVQSIKPPDQRPNVRTIFPVPTGPPPASAPVAVPKSSFHTGHLNFPPLSSSAPASAAIPLPTSPGHSSMTYTEILSVKSAPGLGNDDATGIGSASQMGSQDNGSTVTIPAHGDGDNVSIGGSSTDSTSEDEFSRLKSKRQKERKEKLMQRLARSISAQQAAIGMDYQDNELLLMDLTASSRTGLIPASPRSSNYGDANV